MIGEIINHLWQSTLFACAAGLITLALRKNRAQVRYWIWLSASVKFLIPFSILMGLGTRMWDSLPVARVPTRLPMPALSHAVAQIAQPFSDTLNLVPSVAHPTSNWILIAMLVIWACGFLCIAFIRFFGWLRIRVALRASTPFPFTASVPIRSTPGLVEPGVVGFFDPVLLIPEGILKNLTSAQFESVLVHEQSHVRRRDNLTSAIHMIVEAVFWFHPIVWWIGAMLVEERERACDEAVLTLGNEPHIYAEGILKVCKSYQESPLQCVSGVTGSDLKKRIREILTERKAHDLSFSRRAVLAFSAAVALAAPIFVGVINAPSIRAQSSAAARPQFEVASIKPDRSGEGYMSFRNSSGRFTVNNATIKFIIEFAYNIKDFQLSGGPNWISSDKFDIDAKIEDSVAAALEKLPSDQRQEQVRLMFQSLLSERFNLRVERETKEMPVFALIVAKGGPKLTQTADTPPSSAGDGPTGPPPGPSVTGRGGSPGQARTFRLGGGQINMNGVPISALADALSRQSDIAREVVDETGLKGVYDIALKWTPEGPTQVNGQDASPSSTTAPLPDPSGPSIFSALQDQLGLKLESRKAPTETFVIAHIDKPSGN